MKVYLAGPVQNFEDHDWREDVKSDFPEVEWIDPMDWGPVNIEDAEVPEGVIRKKCEIDLRGADVVLAFLPSDVRSDGTVMEIRAAAAEYDIPVSVVATRFPPNYIGEFLMAHIDYVGHSFEDALNGIRYDAIS